MTLKSLITVFGCSLLTITAVQADDAPGKDEGKRMGRPDREEIVKKFDKDGDGKLSEEERAAAKEAGKKRMEELKKKLDTDGDGTISEEERQAAMNARMEERFKELDKDGNGSLSFEEFKEGIKDRMKNRECPKCADNPGNGVCPHRGPKGRKPHGPKGEGGGKGGPEAEK